MKGILKTLCILMLCFSILLLCAAFPEAAARLQEYAQNGSPQFATVASVQPEQQTSLTLPGKLALLSQKSRGIEILEDETTMSASQAKAAAEKAFAPYLTAGLFPPLEDCCGYFRPLLIQDPASPERHCIVWEGCYIQNSAPYSVTDVLIDDETGNILRLHYDAGQMLYSEHDPGRNLNTFVDIFFNALGIRDHSQYFLEDPYYSDDVCRIQYRIGNTESGSVTLDFVSLPSGFYVTFP